MEENSLNSADICLYLESVFQTTSSKTVIFIDNFDSICYDVDQGDLHRKQERLVSKIILRKLQHLMKIYQNRILITVKK